MAQNWQPMHLSLSIWMVPRLDDSKVELTYAKSDAKGLQTISLIKE